jgi:hypothetical protein
MNADLQNAIVGHPEKMRYMFTIIGYLFGRELYRKYFYCESKSRGAIYAEAYINERLTNVACDHYRVEVWDGEKKSTVLGGGAPKKALPWRADCAEEVALMPRDRATFMLACNQAGWKERAKQPRARSKHMKVGSGTGRH